MSPPHILVIGSGIVGASIAFHLADRGARVTVIEAGEEGGVATPRSWAWINASWGHPDAYVSLRMRAMAEWRKIGQRLPALGVDWCGGLLWDLPPDELAPFAAERDAQGYQAKLVGRAEAARLEPALAAPPELAVHVAGEGVVEPLPAARAFLAAAVELGASRLAAPALGGVGQGGVETDRGWVAADHVVVAAGVGSVALAKTAGYDLPLDTPPGLLVTTEPVDRRILNGLVIAPELSVRQTQAGALVGSSSFGGVEPGEDSAATSRAVFEVMQVALKDGDQLRYRSHTVGHRPTPKDGFPVVGRLPGRDDVPIAVMHSGVTLAPAVGLFLADEILTGGREPLLAPYRPERFLSR